MQRAVIAWALALVALLALGPACSGEKPPYVVVFHAVDEQLRPLPGVTVEVVGTAAQTNASGSVPFQLRGTEGQQLGIKVHCPTGYRVESQDDVLPITLRRVHNTGADGFAASERKIRCVPTRRRVAIVVVLGKAGANLPVLVDEQERTRTDASGVAHMAFAWPPSSSFRVKIDTSSDSGITPPNPSRTFRVSDTDDVFVFEMPLQSVSKPKVEAKPRRRRPRRRAPSGPSPL